MCALGPFIQDALGLSVTPPPLKYLFHCVLSLSTWKLYSIIVFNVISVLGTNPRQALYCLSYSHSPVAHFKLNIVVVIVV